MTSVLDDIYSDSDISDDEWDTQNKKEGKGAGDPTKGPAFISSYYLKGATKEEPTQNVGLISYLSDGIMINSHNIIDPSIGKGQVRVHIICKKKDCEICYGGDNASRFKAWPLIDWLHSYTNKEGKVVARPTFKLMIRGKNANEKTEERKKKFGIDTGKKDNSGQPILTMIGQKWEITRTGEKFKTMYDMLPADLRNIPDRIEPLPFHETTTIQGKEKAYEVPVIQKPLSWPEADEGLETSMQSIYSLQKMKPEDREPDWNEPSSVDEWMKFHFLNVPQQKYLLLGRPIGQAQADSANAGSNGSEDDIPF